MTDPATGLPDLPEGFFWNVEEHRIEIRKWAAWGMWQAKNMFWPGKRRSAVFDIEERQQTRTSRRWLIPYTWTVAESRVRESIVLDYAKYGTYRVEQETIRSHGGAVARTYDREVLAVPDPVTAANLFERATALHKTWSDRHQARELYGAYPPKQFTPNPSTEGENE